MVKVKFQESLKARNISMRILDGETIQIIIPHNLKNRELVINRILKEKRPWIEKHLKKFKQQEKHKQFLPERIEVNGKILEGTKLKNWAKQKIIATTKIFAQKLGFKFDKIY